MLSKVVHSNIVLYFFRKPVLSQFWGGSLVVERKIAIYIKHCDYLEVAGSIPARPSFLFFPLKHLFH